jgi:hypothetical protein
LDQVALEYASKNFHGHPKAKTEMKPKLTDNSEINYLEINDDEDYENFDD